LIHLVLIFAELSLTDSQTRLYVYQIISTLFKIPISLKSEISEKSETSENQNSEIPDDYSQVGEKCTGGQVYMTAMILFRDMFKAAGEKGIALFSAAIKDKSILLITSALNSGVKQLYCDKTIPQLMLISSEFSYNGLSQIQSAMA